MKTIALNLSFRLVNYGGYIIDTRGDKPKYIGLITPSPTCKGYVFCPFVKKTVVFDNIVPDNFKSPRKAQDWVIKHVLAGTVCGGIRSLTRSWAGWEVSAGFVYHKRFQIICLMFVFAICMIFYTLCPNCYHSISNSMVSTGAKVIGAVLGIWSIALGILRHKEPF